MDDVWNGEHLRRVRTWLFDGGVMGSVLYVTLLERRPEPAVVAIGLVMAVAMLGRRRYPLIVACVVYIAAPVHLLFDDAMRLYDMAVLISMFAVVKYRPQLFWGILAGVGAGLGVLIGAAVEARRTDNFGTIAWVVGALTIAVWFSAYGVRTRRLYVASLEERAATLERERDHLSRLAAADERAAIARELHDVVAHSLSVMIVQADGAGYTLDPAASGARQALDTIAATGRDALEDMRRVVSVLRGASPGTGGGSRRRVGLAELDRLVERAGLRVDLDTVGTPAGLSVAEELTAYRIVQESLTNTLRHAGPDARVTLRLEYTADHVAIRATDDGAGRPTAAATTPGGHGLVGMRERIALHGGTVTAGPRFDGGWAVTATIPRAPQSTTAPSPSQPDPSQPDPSLPDLSTGDPPPGVVAPVNPAVTADGRTPAVGTSPAADDAAPGAASAAAAVAVDGRDPAAGVRPVAGDPAPGAVVAANPAVPADGPRPTAGVRPGLDGPVPAVDTASAAVPGLAVRPGPPTMSGLAAVPGPGGGAGSDGGAGPVGAAGPGGGAGPVGGAGGRAGPGAGYVGSGSVDVVGVEVGGRWGVR